MNATPPPLDIARADTMKIQLFSIRNIKHSKNIQETTYPHIKMKKPKICHQDGFVGNVPLKSKKFPNKNLVHIFTSQQSSQVSFDNPMDS